MKPIVIVDINTHDLSLEALNESLYRLPEELLFLEYKIGEYSDGGYYCTWELFQKDWSLLTQLRQFIQEEGLSFDENYGKIIIEEEKLSGQLFDFSTIIFRWHSEIEAPPIIERNCPHCHREHSYLLKNPHLYLSISIENRPKLFYSRSNLWVMAIELRDALIERGLATGLCWYPVTVDEDEQQQYVGIYSDVNIGWPVAPYGSHSPGNKPCPICGSVYPKYNFYHVFHRPLTPAHWMWSPLYGPTSPFISGEVANWLWSEWLKGQTDRLKSPESNENLGPWLRERKEWLKEREKLPLTVPPSPHDRLEEWDIEDFSLIRYGWYPDEAEQAFLPPQYHLEINQPQEPQPTSIPAIPSYLTDTNMPENTSCCQIDREIVLANYAPEHSFWANTLVFIYQNNQVVDCRLTLKVDWEFYLEMQEGNICNLEEDLGTPVFGGDLQAENDVELEIRISPDLLPHLLRHAQTVDEAADYIIQLGREQPLHPLVGCQNWFCTWVKQSFDLEPGQAFESIFQGYSTFWQHLSLSDLTMGQANYKQFYQRLLDEYKRWIEAGSGRVKELSERTIDKVVELFDLVALDIEEAVTKFENLDGEIYQAIMKFFTEQDWSVEPPRGKDFVSFDFSGTNCSFYCRTQIHEKNQEFIFYSKYILLSGNMIANVPKNKVAKIAELLIKANNYLSLGNFELHDLDIYGKTSIRLPAIWTPGNPLNQELLKQLVYANLEMMDKYWPAVEAVLEENLSPEEALASIEGTD